MRIEPDKCVSIKGISTADANQPRTYLYLVRYFIFFKPKYLVTLIP